MVVVIDYKMGNLGSVANMLKRLGARVKVSRDRSEITAAQKLVLPGVGHFAAAMNSLRDLGLIEILNEKVISQQTPILGVCLGMQTMMLQVEEGTDKVLRWFDAEVKRFNFPLSSQRLKVPHMGWNQLDVVSRDCLFRNLPADHRFYFAHSYYVECEKKSDVLAVCNYGLPFVAAVKKSNIWGVQFHPEKSHKFGFQVFKQFLEMTCFDRA